MLTHLAIQNFGLIDQVAIDFDKGLNVLTGATGAGKSIIIDGLRFVLGERMSSSQIREGSASCLVEAVFDLRGSPLRKREDFQDFLANDVELIIQRQYYSDGRGKIKVNGLSVTLTQLKNLGTHLLDFHGPHDHQLLFNEDQHLSLLDQLTDFDKTKDLYTEQFEVYARLKQELAALDGLTRSRERDLDLLAHQVKELGLVGLTREQYDTVCREQLRLNNSERLAAHAAKALEILEEPESGLCELSRGLFTPLKALNQIDSRTSELTELSDTIQTNSDDLAVKIRKYLEGLDFEPAQAEEINRRYDTYNDILRKYGPTLDDAAEFYRQAKERFDLLNNLEHNDAQLKAKIFAAEKTLAETAVKLTKARQKSAAQLKKTIEKELQELGMPQVRFEAQVTPAEFDAHGRDKVVFHISPNAGEGLKPLAEIVSSGEAARVMLALKKALIKADPVPVLVFDEIDAQIGGRLGTVTGTKLKELSQARQVLLITHLPQIASFADLHLKVSKDIVNKRSVTQVSALSEENRVQELAHMMSGDRKTSVALTHAEDMLSHARGV